MQFLNEIGNYLKYITSIQIIQKVSLFNRSVHNLDRQYLSYRIHSFNNKLDI